MKSAIAYYRVSTERQGKSGLGLEAQQAAVRSYCTVNELHLLSEIQEVKSTRKQRPGLQEALETCRKYQATLIVAKLDRLGRDVEEIARIVKSSVPIIVTDNPHANRFTVHILAAVAEEQRRTISENTRLALQAAKRRGVELGAHGKVLAVRNKKRADAFAKAMKPILRRLAGEGITTVRAISNELNKRKVAPYQAGCRWHKTSVYNLLIRLKKLKKIEVELLNDQYLDTMPLSAVSPNIEKESLGYLNECTKKPLNEYTTIQINNSGTPP